MRNNVICLLVGEVSTARRTRRTRRTATIMAVEEEKENKCDNNDDKNVNSNSNNNYSLVGPLDDLLWRCSFRGVGYPLICSFPPLSGVPCQTGTTGTARRVHIRIARLGRTGRHGKRQWWGQRRWGREGRQQGRLQIGRELWRLCTPPSGIGQDSLLLLSSSPAPVRPGQGKTTGALVLISYVRTVTQTPQQ